MARASCPPDCDGGPEARATPAIIARIEFFIVGCPRSGTTLLSVLLDRHSRLCVPPETGFYDEIAPKLPRTNLLRLLQRWRRLPELGLTAEEVMQELPQSPQRRDVLAAILRRYALARAKPRSGEKTPQHLLHVPKILADFPQPKILCLMRDGRDNALSLHAMPWWRWTLRGATRLWVKCARLARQFEAAHPSQFLVVRYEELVRDPRGTLARVMGHVGETFEPTQLDPAVESRSVLPRSLQWKGRALGAIDAAHAGRRTTGARARQLAVIERIAGDELRLHGYDRIDSPRT